MKKILTYLAVLTLLATGAPATAQDASVDLGTSSEFARYYMSDTLVNVMQADYEKSLGLLKLKRGIQGNEIGTLGFIPTKKRFKLKSFDVIIENSCHECASFTIANAVLPLDAALNIAKHHNARMINGDDTSIMKVNFNTPKRTARTVEYTSSPDGGCGCYVTLTLDGPSRVRTIKIEWGC